MKGAAGFMAYTIRQEESQKRRQSAQNMADMWMGLLPTDPDKVARAKDVSQRRTEMQGCILKAKGHR